MQHVERVRYVAGNYGGVQGLRVVPLGVWFWLVAVGESGYDATGWMPLWGVVAVYFVGPVVAFGLWAAIGALYERAFGSVLGHGPGGGGPGRAERRARAAFVALAVVAALLSPPVWVFGAAMAWALYVFWRSQRPFGYHHYAVMAVLALALVALDVLPVVPTGAWKAVDLAMVGAVLVVGGVLDHLLLSRSMGPVAGEDRGRAA